MFKDHSAVMLLIDPYTGQIGEANQTAAQYYGYPLEDMIQMEIQQLNILAPAEFTEKTGSATSGQANIFEFRHVLADGQVRDVFDTGRGIANAAIDKIFDPFYSTKFPGRGLGLPVVFGIGRAHDGVITVASKEYGGTFRVFLPLTAEEIPRQPGKIARLFTKEGSGTALLIEDEKIRRQTEKFLHVEHIHRSFSFAGDTHRVEDY